MKNKQNYEYKYLDDGMINFFLDRGKKKEAEKRRQELDEQKENLVNSGYEYWNDEPPDINGNIILVFRKKKN